MRNILLAFAIVTYFAGTSYGFEIDGFKDGTTKDIVLNKIKYFNYDWVNDEGENISMYDEPDRNTYRHINMSFYENKLVGFQKNYKPTMANYISLFKELGDKFGKRVDCKASSELSSSGEHKNITCKWKAGKEEVEISYNIFPSNDQLSVYYSAYDKYTNK